MICLADFFAFRHLVYNWCGGCADGTHSGALSNAGCEASTGENRGGIFTELTIRDSSSNSLAQSMSIKWTTISAGSSLVTIVSSDPASGSKVLASKIAVKSKCGEVETAIIGVPPLSVSFLAVLGPTFNLREVPIKVNARDCPAQDAISEPVGASFQRLLVATQSLAANVIDDMLFQLDVEKAVCSRHENQ